ncbi:MAG TPA: PspA/IM30 family protein [Chloroflexota bacterium]|jgi:phage shock protein A
MGLIGRMMAILRAKISSLLDRAEDPHETLEYSYERQLELLQKVKRGIVDAVTSRRRLELQAGRLQENIAKLETQARQAMAAGREDLARLALERKALAAAQLNDLNAQIAQLQQEQEKLTAAEARLSMKVEAFRTRKELIKAQYSAAEAQVRIGEAVSGLSEEMADVGLAIERAEEKTAQLQARASAIDELVASGVLEDVTGSRADTVERELQKIGMQQSVEAELAALRQQFASGGASQRKEGES